MPLRRTSQTARTLGETVNTKQFFCLDDYYDSDRQAYYRILQSVDQEALDLTNWSEYFVEGVNVSIEAVKERVTRLSSETLRKAKRGQMALTERQMPIVERVSLKGQITNREVRKMFQLSNRAALDEIDKLIEPQILEPKGKGRRFITC